MPDPLTVLLDAIHVEVMWWWDRLQHGHYDALLYYPVPDSLSGRNVFWVTVIKGR